jgi:hypothetical protein
MCIITFTRIIRPTSRIPIGTYTKTNKDFKIDEQFIYRHQLGTCIYLQYYDVYEVYVAYGNTTNHCDDFTLGSSAV